MYFLTWLAWCLITLKLILSIFIVLVSSLNETVYKNSVLSKFIKCRDKQVFSKRGVFQRSRGRGFKNFSGTRISAPPLLDWCALPGLHTTSHYILLHSTSKTNGNFIAFYSAVFTAVFM